ncbi:MAG: isoprenyl transferase [Acidobacteriota bacterium]|jgi:undecaprenyl diphosphate synthase|nr:isoprenyl transferase [Acidobacteriota bacterium]MDQ3373234.1 isoprenyl transferase [Acidobacteriota bacterium]
MRENFAEVIKPKSIEAELLAAIDLARLPNHVAVIMDGNGRWAKQRGKPRVFGHRAGVESVRTLLDTSARIGLKALTLYAFSTENWKRPADEVGALMQMLIRYLRSELKEVHNQNIRFQAIGKIDGLPADVQREVSVAMEKTQNNTGTILSIALNYGGRAEIVEACRKAAQKFLENGNSFEDLDEADIEENLYTSNLPEVDLLIRTSGEMRISNFLLWQLAYSEIYVTETLFPDFRRKDIFEAILNFQKRERRFGGIESK